MRFIIPAAPRTSTKSIRFPNDMIARVEAAINGTDCTFTAFVVEAVRVALQSLEVQDDNGTPAIPTDL